MATTNRLTMPLLEASQAQKHVTVNEALQIIDAIVQTGVIDKDLTTPPASPSEGDIYIVGASATGAWDGQDDDVAIYQDGGWVFVTPSDGWIAWVTDESTLYVYESGWGKFSLATEGIASLFGVNTTADTTNRLAVKSDAVLFSHDDVTPGTGDIHIKTNKDAGSNDAAFVFQTAFSTRAIFGLLANDDFTMQVSPDGNTYTQALIIDKDSGAVDLPQHPKFSGYCNFGQTYTMGAWRDFLVNNFRHNDQSSITVVSNVATFTAPHDGYYLFGLGATYQSPGGSSPDFMKVGLSVNGANPTGDRLAVTGDASFVATETAVYLSSLIKLSSGDTVNPQVYFETNNGRIPANENYFWGAQIT